MKRANWLLTILICGCGTPSAGPASPQDQARADYADAEEAYTSGNFLESVKLFQQVRSRHPYSAFSALAELRVGDSQFELGKYAEAAGTYDRFARLHPHHEKIAYARFRESQCHFKEMPEDWLILPPAHEKDRTSTHAARKSLERFLAEHTKSEYVPEAQEMAQQCTERLANYERYVADFYLQRGELTAAAGRLDRLVSNYPGASGIAEALVELAGVYQRLDRPDDAARTWKRLLDDYPESEFAPQARGAVQSPLPESGTDASKRN